MSKVFNVIKYIAIYYGFMRIVGFITVKIMHVTPNNFDSVYGTTGVIAVLLTIACLRIETTDIVRKAPTKKSKVKYFLLVLITLGVVAYIYKKRREASF